MAGARYALPPGPGRQAAGPGRARLRRAISPQAALHKCDPATAAGQGAGQGQAIHWAGSSGGLTDTSYDRVAGQAGQAGRVVKAWLTQSEADWTGLHLRLAPQQHARHSDPSRNEWPHCNPS